MGGVVVLSLTGSGHILTLFILIGIHAIVTLGLTLLMGFAGQVSLGQSVFWGMGAYGAGVLSTRLGVNPWITIPLAGLMTGLVSLTIGWPTLRLRGNYLALATLGLGIIGQVLMKGLPFTGGSSGLLGIPSLSIGVFQFNSDQRFIYLVWGVLVILLIFARNYVYSPQGRDLVAIGDKELAAKTAGVLSHHAKLNVFVMSAVCASIGGSLYAYYMNFISPDSFGLQMSITFVLMTIVGGITSIWGPVVGSIIINSFVDVFRFAMEHLVGNISAEAEFIAFGLLLLLLVTFLPNGIMGILDRRVSGKCGEQKKEGACREVSS